MTAANKFLMFFLLLAAIAGILAITVPELTAYFKTAPEKPGIEVVPASSTIAPRKKLEVPRPKVTGGIRLPESEHPEHEEFYTSLNEAKKAAAKQKKLILAVFTGTDWCKHSERFEEECFNTPEFQKFTTAFVVLKIERSGTYYKDSKVAGNFDESDADERRLSPERAYPSLVIADATGIPRARLIGFRQAEKTLRQLKLYHEAVIKGDNKELLLAIRYDHASKAIGMEMADKEAPAPVKPEPRENAEPEPDRPWRKGPSGWLNNYSIARKMAKIYKKKILVLFDGSDWNSASMRLKSEVLETYKFKSLTQPYAVLLYIDSPRTRNLEPEQLSHNHKLKSQLNVGDDLPCTVLLDENGKEIDRLDGFPSRFKYLLKLHDWFHPLPFSEGRKF